MAAPTAAMPPSPTRASLLDHHAAQLQHRSAALDLRAHELSQAEARLSHRLSALQTRTHALSRLESTARSEMASLLEAVTSRHEKLSDSESRLRQREQSLKKKVSALRGTLRNAAAVERRLREKQDMLRETEKRKEEMLAALEEAEERLRKVERVSNAAEERAAKVAQEGDVLRTAADKLEMLEREVRKRDKEIGNKERAVREGEERVERLLQFEDVVHPMRRFVGECAILLAEEGRGTASELPEGAAEDAAPQLVAAEAIVAVRELCAMVRALRGQREAQDAREARLEQLEKQMKKEEGALRVRERSLKLAEGRLDVAQQSLKAVQSDVDKAWAEIESGRTDLDRREESVRLKEADVIEADQRRRRKESSVLQGEKMLVRRERSIQRAHATVGEREKAVEQRQRDLDEEKASLQNLKTTIDLKEDLLHTRELEFTAREAKKNAALDALLEASVRKKKRRSSREHSFSPESGSGSSPTPELRVLNPTVVETRGENVQRTVQSAPAPASTSQAARPTAQSQANKLNGALQGPEPSTVRRQLEFETTVQRQATTTGGAVLPAPLVSRLPQAEKAPNQDDLDKAPTHVANNDDDDNESEAAADDLLPELIGARALWKERVVRLEAVVENMRENTWALKPHVQPILTSVSTQLQDIHREIDSTPERHLESSKASYGTEQQRQVRWGSLIREQLDAVRDVQTGMLIALNKEEDSMFQESGPAPLPSEQSESATQTTSEPSEGAREKRSPPHMAGDESSVDVTLDATDGRLFPDHSLEATEDFGSITSSFRKFRRQMRAQRGLAEASRNSRIIRRERVPREAPARVRPRQPVGRGVVVRETRGIRGSDLLRELESVRNDLESITGSTNSSGLQ